MRHDLREINVHEDIYRKATKNEGPGEVNDQKIP